MSKKTPPHFDMARREINRCPLTKVRIFIPYLAPTNDLVITKAESHKQKLPTGSSLIFTKCKSAVFGGNQDKTRHSDGGPTVKLLGFINKS